MTDNNRSFIKTNLMKKTVIIIFFMAILPAFGLFAQQTEPLKLKGSQGNLYAELQRPDTVGRVPLVILCHGFGGNCQSRLFNDIAEDLYRNRIATLRFDFNGHGKSDGLFQNMTVLNEIEDLKDVIKWARQQSWVENISLLGHSQGGVVASMTAGELGDEVIKNVVLMAPAAVLRDDALRGNTMGAQYDPWNMTADYVQLPFGGLKLGRKYIETAVNLPIYETAFNYDGPVLVIHGTRDRVVPYTYGERYNQGYKHSSIKLLPGEDHGFNVNTSEAALYASDWLINQLRADR